MSSLFLINIFNLALIAGAIVLIVISITASAYDFSLIARRNRLLATERRLRYPRQPSVTVIVYCRDNQTTIKSCLTSLARSRYHNFDVVVVDNKSSDNTRFIIRQFIATSDIQMKLLAKRKLSTRAIAVLSAYKKSQKGDFMIVIGADTVVMPGWIKQSVARFIIQPSLAGLRFSELTTQPDSLNSILIRYYQISRNIFIKALSTVGLSRLGRGSLNAMYRIDRLKINKVRLSFVRCGYGPLLNRDPRAANSSLVGVMSAFALASVVSYFMYLAASLQNSSLLLVSWALLVAWLLVSMWLDSSVTNAQKIKMSIFAPSIYFIGYAQLIITLLSKINHKIIHN